MNGFTTASTSFFVELTQIINRVLLNCFLLSKVKNHLNICFFKVKSVSLQRFLILSANG